MPAPASRIRVLFGEHGTQVPAIRAHLDHDRYHLTVGPLAGARAGDFDLVVPLTVPQIAEARALNTADRPRRALLPDADVVALTDDKLTFNERLIALGFGEHVPALLPDPPDRRPFIRKARRGDFGAGCRIVRTGEDDEPIPDSFCQAAVEGAHEDVVHLIRADGTIHLAIACRYDMGRPLTVRGAADRPVAITPIDPAPALPVCADVLDALQFEGLGCFNLKWEGDRPMILELNPRFGGSLVGEVTRTLDVLAALAG